MSGNPRGGEQMLTATAGPCSSCHQRPVHSSGVGYRLDRPSDGSNRYAGSQLCENHLLARAEVLITHDARTEYCTALQITIPAPVTEWSVGLGRRRDSPRPRNAHVPETFGGTTARARHWGNCREVPKSTAPERDFASRPETLSFEPSVNWTSHGRMSCLRLHLVAPSWGTASCEI